MNFGFTTYTWQVSSTHRSLDHILDVVADCGGQGIESEVCTLGGYAGDPDKLKDLLTSRGVALAAVCYVEDWRHDSETDDESARAQHVIDYLSHFAGSLLQLCPRSGKDRRNLRERQQNAIRCINAVARRAADKGVHCVVHPNSPSGSVFRTRGEYEILLDGLDSSSVGFAPDTGHIVRGGMDPLEMMRAYRSLVTHVHFKDMSAEDEWAGIGDGIADFPTIVSYLAVTGYTGWVIAEDESALAESDPDEATHRNAAYIRDRLVPLTR